MVACLKNLAALGAAMVAVPIMAMAADPIPAYMDIAVGKGAPIPQAEVAADNIKALDDGMQAAYSLALGKYKAHIRETLPIIIARFDDYGGAMTLYPPGEAPIHAPQVPEIYTIVKSVSHSMMAMYQLVAPHLGDPSDGSWRGPMAVYLARAETARSSLKDLQVPDNVRKRLGKMLDAAISFMERCLNDGTFTFAQLESFARAVEPDIVKNVALAAQTQVDHWEGVIGSWKEMLGPKWDETHAITNTLYVTRQNNILFTILAQFMGEEAIDDRLLLVGTTDFVTTEAKLLDLISRILADRPLGAVFFRNIYLMDAELVGSAARHAVELDAAKQGKKALLPTLAPFDTHQWPWPTDPASGTGPATMQEIPGD